jgi:integrase/recombinase XerD
MWVRVEGWLAGIGSHNTRLAYRRDLEVFVAWLDDSGSLGRAVSTRDIEDFRMACEAAGSSAATVRRRLAAVSSFYRSHGGPPASNPVGMVERPQRPAADDSRIVLDARSLSALWDAASQAGGRTAVLLALLLFDGLSTHQLLGIDVDQLDVGRRQVTIDRNGLLLVLDPRTASAIRRHLGARRTGPLLADDRVTGSTERLTRFGVDYLVKQAGRRAGIDHRITVTTIRRSVALAAPTGRPGRRD